MTIKTNTWHFRAYRFMQTEPMEKWKPTVCGYWSTVFIGIPTFCIFFVAFLPMIPILWVTDKLEAKFKGKSICPFGRVEFEVGTGRRRGGR